MKKIVVLLLLGICSTNMVFTYEYDEVMELLEAEPGGNISFLSKINLGIPGGENWIALRGICIDAVGKVIKGLRYMCIYTVNIEKETVEKERKGVPEQSKIDYNGKALEYDIMQSIPGTQIGSSAAAFGDYNGDGIDEIFWFYLGIEHYCVIRGYNSDKDRIDDFLECRYNITSINEPSPVEFINYKGIDGIKIYFWDYLDKINRWRFWAWDEGSRKYIELASSENEEIDYSKFIPVPPKMDNESDGDQVKAESVAIEEGMPSVLPVESIAIEEEAPSVLPADNDRNIRFVIKTGIISVIVILAVILCFIVIKRKKG